MVTKEELINFSKEIASYYEQGKIRSPIHLHGGNEDELIELFAGEKSLCKYIDLPIQHINDRILKLYSILPE